MTKKISRFVLLLVVFCMVFSVSVSAKGKKKKMGFDEYCDIYWDYFNTIISNAETLEDADPAIRHWWANMGPSSYWEINAYVYDMDKDGVYECIITYPISKTDWRKNGVEFWSCDKNNKPYKLKSPKIKDAYVFKTSNISMYYNRARKGSRNYQYKKGVIISRRKNSKYNYYQIFEKKGNTIKAKDKYIDKTTKKKGKTVHAYYKNSKKISKSAYVKWRNLACWDMPYDFGYGKVY